MSFASPIVLVALAAIPVLAVWYVAEQRRRTRAAAVFAARPLTPSVAPTSPRWRRHAPMLVLALALVALIIAAARPQRSVAVPVKDGAVMLANDISGSMDATDVSPSRLVAAEQAARRFIAKVPATIRVGVVTFARTPTLLQSPTFDHAAARSVLSQLHTSGGTAMGEALQVALHSLTTLRSQGGKRPPGAIVLISDGASNVGVSPVAIARQAASLHIPVYTISVGTASGTIPIRHGSRTVTTPVPVDPTELTQIAQSSGGRHFTAADAAGVSAVYTHLAAELGHKKAKHEMTASFAGGGLILLLIGSVGSLYWFGRLV
jgi:Ca-activated chloride channel family protein